MTLEAEFWVTVATVIFVGILIYAGVHRRVVEGIDARRARIESELAEAARLKAEAAELLAEYQRRQKAAEAEAQGIIEGARADAERIAADARLKMEEFVARRTTMAENKIAQAEAQALADVRSAAVDAAVAAAETILRERKVAISSDDLVARGIAEVKAKLN